MTIEFDDLIPSNTNIEFDDLIPRGPGFTDQMANGVRALFGNIVTPFNAAEKIGQLANTVNPPKPTGSVFERVPVERAPFNFARASGVQRAIDDQLEREAQFGTIGPIVGPQPSVSSVASGLVSDLVSGGKAARAGINQMAGDITGSEHFLSQARREAAQAELMRAVNTPDFETETARGIYGGLSSTVRQLPAIAAAVATRNPNIALGGMVAPMVPEEYGKFRQRGADPLPALAGAAGTAATEYITEKLPMGFLVQQFGRAGAGQFLTGMLAREVPGEQLATLVQDAIDTAIANPDKTWGDYLAERPSAAYQTLLATITQTGIMGGANAVANRLTGQPEQRAPELPDYQEAAARVFGRTTPPAPPAQPPVQPPAPPDAEVVNRILQAIEQTQNVPNVPPAPRAETQAPADQAPAPAGSDATPAAVLPDAGGSGDVQATGLTFDDLVPATTEAATTEAAPAVTPEPVTQPAPAVGTTAEGAGESRPTQVAPILQNRNRATPSSIAQMQSIATQPDYGRLGFSRDFANGAPVVAGGQIAPEQLGRQDVAVASDGRRIPVQYAVVEAADVLPSNQADGTPNPDYGNQSVQRIRAIAGNGRIAGLQLAYRKGTAPGYLNELTSDTLHGVSPDVIRAMRAPVLVRVMPTDQVTADIGDVSNTVGNLNLSAVEQANNDAQRVNLDTLQFAEDGSITPEAVRQFVRAMPQAEQGGLIDTNGQPTKQAVDRINAAVFAKAYGNDELVRLYAQAQDPEARNVLSALAQVAPKMARLEGAGALDIRGVVTQAAEIAVNARRGGRALSLAAQQLDLAADPMVGVVLDLFAANSRSVKPVVEALSNAADLAYTEATKPAEDMFGAVPRASREDVINQLRPQNERASQENLEQPAGRESVQVDAGRAEAQPAAATDPTATEAGRPAETEGLTEPRLDNQGRDLGAVRRNFERLEREQQQGAENARAAFERTTQETPLPEWTEADGQLVMRSGQSKHVAVPRNGKKTAATFDVVNLESGQLVTQLKRDEVKKWLWETAKTENEAAPEPLLTAPTAEEVVARQDAAEAAQREAEAADRKAAEDERRRQERAEIARRSEAAADTFELGQDPMDNLTGQGDIFSAPAEGVSGNGRFDQGALTERLSAITGVSVSDVSEDLMFGTGTSFVLNFPDTKLQMSVRDDGDSIYVINIHAKDPNDLSKQVRGTGRGREAVEALRKYADQTGKPLSIVGVTEGGDNFWKSFDWLKPSNVSLQMGDRAVTNERAYTYIPQQLSQPSAPAEPGATYNAEAPRRKFTDDRQLQLFLDNGPDRSQAGPRGEAAQREAVAAVDDLRSTATILGLALSRDYAARQRVSLVGQKVSSAEDLAVLAQVYRDPRFETFRVVFVNDAGKVVSQVGLTSRLPASTQAVMGSDVNAYLSELSATARNRGATGFYMLHNHPSGLATPSVADRSLTQTFALTMPSLEFKSHVVIDTNEYSTIDAKGRSETLKKDFGQPAPYRAQEWADVQISGPADVMSMAKRLQVDDGAITLIHTDSQYRVKAISTIPNDASTMSKQELKKQVLRASLQTQGANVFAVGRDSKALTRIGTMVVDAIYVEDSGQAQSLRSMGVIAGGAPLPSDRRTRVSPDTSPEFAYLRRQSQPAPMQRVAEPSIDQTQTPEFRRWFGDSKVVDANGRPLVVYHGTAADISFFDKLALGESTKAQSARRGFFFAASPKVASGYAMLSETRPALRNAVLRNAAQSDVLPPDLKQMLLEASEQFSQQDMQDSVWIDEAGGGVTGANVLPVYLSIKNPMVVDYGGKNYRERKFSDVIAEAKAAGHDGVVFRNAEDSAHKAYSEVTDIFVAFRPEQIKSATGNRGTFDPNDSSIVREEGAEYSPEPPQNPNRDALGRLKFRLGEVALHKLDAVTRPLQERFGMRMASPELRKQLRQMKATIEEAKRAAVNVAKEMNAMTEADRAMVSDIVEKMIAPGVVPPEHAVKVADAITRTMDQQTDELVALGMLSQDSADRWRGRYLPRIYSRETELTDDPLIKRLFKTGTPTMAGIGGGSLKGRGLFQDVSVDAVDQWLAMGYEVRDPHWRLNQGKLELKDPNAPKVARDQVTVWRDWTASERAQMGENRDAMYRFVMGYTAMQRDIALGRLFNNIANNTEWVRRSGAEGWVKVPDSEIPDTGGVKRYGTLAGLYVRRDVMSHLTQFEEAANDTLQLYREALGIWKEGKTALNPVAHFNNVMGNVSMAHFAGVSYWDGHKYVNAVRDLVNDAAMVDEARKVGLFTGSFTKEEMVQAMPPELQKLANMEEGKARRAGKLVMNAMTFWLRKPLRDAYEFEDTFFKYLIYRDARQQGLNPTEAMDYALRYIFAYDDLPSGARKVRDYAIPFFSWTYKAIPALLHTAMVYPWRFLAPAAVLHGINIVAYSLAAGDEDDNWLEKIAKGRELEEEEREVLPDRMQGMGMLANPKSIRLGTDDVTGHPIYLDASRVIPGGDMFDMVNQAGGIALPAPLMPNHPILSAFSAMIVNREMFFGRDITDRNDTSAEAFEKRAKWMAGFLLPAVSPGGYHSQRILDATANAMDTVITTPLGEFTGVDRSGLPVQPKFAAMQTIGIKARPVDLELEEQRRRTQEAALINSIAAEVRSMARLNQRGAVSDEMMDRTRERAREKIERIREER